MKKDTWVGLCAVGWAAVFGTATTVDAQQGTAVISGQVTAEGGRALAGATVAISELNAGVFVNDAGRYTLLIPAARVSGQTVTLRARFIDFYAHLLERPRLLLCH